ncbi:MAG: recombinase family protein [Planctomycetota bacterium]|nr:recombinase family protein [Planctomycetota bacterium]
MTVRTTNNSTSTTVRALKAFIYLRVSTPAQEIDEQVKMIRQYASDHGVEIIGQYGDYQKRHKAAQRGSFQAMLNDLTASQPDMILVQRLDRFGTADSNELGYFITLLKRQGVRLITVVDGQDRSKSDLATTITNTIAAGQSRQEQIDKAERVLIGKRHKAVLGEYIGSKTLVYGFDLVCIGREGLEKWRMVEDSWSLRIKFIRNNQNEYVEAERYVNEIIKDDNAIMADKEIRHRPAKDSSDRLFYSPSIRQERVDTLRRIFEWFDSGWTTYRIAKQLNEEGIRPVYADHWYSSFIDGLLDNSVIVGRPAWNRTSQSTFRHIEGGRITDTGEEFKGVYRLNDKAEWFMPDEEVFEPFIDAAVFERVQIKLMERRSSTPIRSPRSEDLWLGGLWYDADTGEKLSGNSQGKHFRAKHPDHHHKRLTFKEAEWFISEYLCRLGQKLDTVGEAVGDNKLLERLETDVWLKELHLEYIRLDVERYLGSRLEPGINTIGGINIVLDHDEERNVILFSDCSLLEVYCAMIKEDMERDQQVVNGMLEERKRLTLELMAMRNKSKYITDSYNDRILQLSNEIEAATSAPDFMNWWEQVKEEIDLLRRQQEKIKQAIAQGGRIKKAETIRNLIERIDCKFINEPTTDGRCKGGFRAVCISVTIHSKTTNGQPIPTMTIETPSESSWC